MSPVTHFLTGWILANVTPLTRREKAAVVCASVVPDLDGLGAIPEIFTRNSAHPLQWFSDYHHSLHTLAFAVVVTLATLLFVWPRRSWIATHEKQSFHPWTTAFLAFLSFHLHLLCDLVGSRGPDGYSWPIPYLYPFSGSLQLGWHGQWALNGWQNIVITTILLLATLFLARKNSTSPLELISSRANQALVAALRNRFPIKTDESAAR
jgi:inner membrane protein